MATPKKKAVLIGNNYKDTDNALHGCANDVLNMKKLLMQNGYAEEDIIMISDDIPKAIFPSSKNILSELNKLIDNAIPGDDLFIHYSGHGTQERDLNNDEDDRKDEGICPLEIDSDGNKYIGDTIRDDELKKLVNKVPVGARLFGLFDCCHSATIFDLQHNVVQGNGKKPDRMHGFTLLFSGCKDSQTSADAYIDNINQGALTAGFMKMVKKYNGFKNFMDLCFSGVTSQLVKVQSQLNTWLKKNDFEQIPNIAWECETANFLTSFKTKENKHGKQHVLRQVPSRKAERYELENAHVNYALLRK